MATQIIKVEFDLPLPDEYMVDHNRTQNKSRKYTYHGPDKIYLQIGSDGYEKYGPLTEDDKADGRPLPADCTEFFEVDCTQYPLICQLRGPIVNESQEVSGPILPDNETANTQTGEAEGKVVNHPQSPALDGYEQYKYSLPILPKFVWDMDSVRVVDGVPTARMMTVNEVILGEANDDYFTVEDIRDRRNADLEASDGAISSDMPTAMVNQWTSYRQKLRDWPALVTSNGIPAAVAAKMSPIHPNSARGKWGEMTDAQKAREKAKMARVDAAAKAQMEAAKPTEDQNPGL